MRAVGIEIGAGQGLRTPAGGFGPEAGQILLDEARGPSPILPVSSSPLGSLGRGAGILFESADGVAPLAAGAAAAMKIEFRPSMPVRSGESVVISLPGFAASCATPPCGIGTGFSASTGASLVWDGRSSELKIGPSQEFSPDVTVLVLISGDFGLELPSVGVRFNQTSLTIASDAVAGPVSPVGLISAPGVGSFNNSPALSWGDGAPEAGKPINMTLCLSAQMDLSPGDALTLVLPGFGGPSESRALQILSSENISAVWIPSPYLPELVFLVSSHVPPNKLICSTVPENQNLSLPARGILIGSQYTDTYPLIFSNATAGAVRVPSPVLNFPPVGVFLKFSLDFQPRVPGNFSSIRLTFSLTSALRAGDSVFVSLPEFSVDNRTIDLIYLQKNGPSFNASFTRGVLVLVCIAAGSNPSSSVTSVDISTSSARVRGVWMKASEIGMNLSNTNISANDTFLINFSTPTGMILPARGLLTSQKSLAIWTDAHEGPSLVPVPVMNSPTVGVQSSSLTFSNPASAGVFVSYTFTVVLTFNLFPGDLLSFVFPEYFNFTGSKLLSGGSSTKFSKYGSFSANMGAITFTAVCTAQILSLESISLAFSSYVPTQGISDQVPQSSIFIVLSNGRMAINQPFSNVQSIPGFFFASLEFTPKVAGQLTTIKVSFRSSTDIPSGSQIILYLPLFAGAAKTGINVISTESLCSSVPATWYSSTNEFLIYVSGKIQSNRTVDILIPATSSGMLLPQNGLSASQGDLKIQILGPNFNTIPLPFTRSDSVGIFKISLLNFSKYSGSNVSIVFSLNKPVMVGESISILLPGFTVPQGSLKVYGDSAANFNFTYQSNNTMLVLTVAQPSGLQPSALISLTIAGFSPRLSSPPLIMTNAEMGAASFQPFSYFPPPSSPRAAFDSHLGLEAELLSAKKSSASARLAQNADAREAREPSVDPVSDVYRPVLYEVGAALDNDRDRYANEERTGRDETAASQTHRANQRRRKASSLSIRFSYASNKISRSFLTYDPAASNIPTRVRIRFQVDSCSGCAVLRIFLPQLELIPIQSGDASVEMIDDLNSILRLEQYATWSSDSNILTTILSNTLTSSSAIWLNFSIPVTAGFKIRNSGTFLLPKPRLSVGFSTWQAASSDFQSQLISLNFFDSKTLLALLRRIVQGKDILYLNLLVSSLMKNLIFGFLTYGVVSSAPALQSTSLVSFLSSPIDNTETDAGLMADAAAFIQTVGGPDLETSVYESGPGNILVLLFVTNSSLAPQTKIDIYIPGIACITSIFEVSSCCTVGSSLIVDPLKNATWKENTSTLTIFVNASIPVNSICRMFSSNLLLPPKLQEFQYSQPVGSFSDTVSIDFPIDQRTGSPATVYISFSPMMDVLSSETITLHLPGLYTRTQRNDNSLLDEDGFFQQSTWLQSKQNLVLTVQRPISAMNNVSLILTSGYGLVLNADGILPGNWSNISISTDAINGPVPPTPVSKVTAISTFIGGTSLQYMRDGSLSLGFALPIPIHPGDTITLKLPLFGGAGTSCISIKNYIVSYASWNIETSQLDLTVGSYFPAFEIVDIQIPSLVGIHLPLNGLIANQTQLMISGNFMFGRVAFISISNSPPVGSLALSELRYNPAYAGQATELAFSFMANMMIAGGEYISLVLPGFTRSMNLSSVFWCFPEPSDVFTSGTWETLSGKEGGSVKFIAARSISSQSLVLLRIPLDVSISLPDNGLTANESDILFVTNAQAGPLLSGISVLSSQPVGSFRGSTKLTFNPAAVKQTVSISIEFKSYMIIQVNEYISVKLPQFSCSASDNLVLDDISKLVWRASWNVSSEEFVLIRYGKSTAQGEIQLIVILSANLCTLPSSGVEINHPTITISTNAISGPVPESVFSYVEAVGVFEHSSISFDPPRAGSNVTVQFNWKFLRDMQVGDVVTFSMCAGDSDGHFVIPSASVSTTGNGSIYFPYALMTSHCSDCRTTCSMQIEFQAGIYIPQKTFIDVQIQKNIGIVTPGRGISENSPLTISTNAESGPVLPTMLSYRPIGYFDDTALVVDPPKAGGLANLTIQLLPRMNIAAGSTLVLELPGFTGDSFQEQKIYEDLPTSVLMSMTWSNQTNTLNITIREELPANKLFSVLVPSDSGISLPRLGIQENDPGYKIGTDNPHGEVLPTSFMSCSEVLVTGSLQSSFVRFNHEYTVDPSFVQNIEPSAGESAFLMFGFSARMLLLPNDMISVYLPDFASEDDESFTTVTVARILSQYVELQSSWDSENSTFSVILSERILPRTPISFSVRSRLKIPDFGVRINGSGISIEATAQAGSAQPTPFWSLQPVGFFNNSVSLDFKPLVAAPVFPYTTLECCEDDSQAENCCYDSQKRAQNEISLSFVAYMNIMKNDLLILALCLFLGPEFGSQPTVSNVGTFQAAWINGSSVQPAFTAAFAYASGNQCSPCNRFLVIKAMTNVQARNRVQLSISGLLLPTNGVASNDNCIFFKANAAEGSTPFTKISQFPAVGAFWNTSIHFGNPLAGEISSISVSLTPASDIWTGSYIYVTLPGFDGPQFSCEENAQKLASPFADSTWNLTRRTITVEIVQNITAGSQVAITVPSTALIRLPQNGISNMAPLTIASDGLNAPIFPIQILLIPNIGMGNDGMFSFSRLAYLPLALMKPVRITLFFKFSLTLFPGALIQVLLPEFQHSLSQFNISASVWEKSAKCPTGHLGLDGMGIDIPKSCGKTLSTSLSNASFSSEDSDVLEMRVLSEISSGLAVEVIIPQSSGIKLPQNGLESNQKDLKIRISSIYSSYPLSDWFSIKFSPSVTALRNVGIQFIPPSTISEVDLLLYFEMVLQLEVGDSIFLNLPGFQATNGSFPVLSICRNSTSITTDGIISGSWSVNADILTFTVAKDLSPLTRCTVTVNRGVGALRLPLEGLLADDLSLAIGANTTAGIVNLFPIANTSAIGSFLNKTVIDYTPQQAGVVSSLQISFVTSMDLDMDENVILYLPGFRVGLDLVDFQVPFSFDNTSYDSSQSPFWNASWVENESRLILTCGLPIAPGQKVVVSVSSEIGIRLPIRGIRGNAALLISTNAVMGPVPPTKVFLFPPVGAFSSSTLIDGYPRRPGQRITFILNFTAYMDLTDASSIRLHLPDFTSVDQRIVNGLTLQSSAPTNSTFRVKFVSEFLIIYVNKSVAALTPISLVIPSSAGIKLPDHIMVACSAGVYIETNQETGNVTPTPIKSPGIYYSGKFAISRISFSKSGGFGIAGLSCGVNITLSPVMNLYPGEEIIITLNGLQSKPFITSPSCCIQDIDGFGNIDSECRPNQCIRFAVWNNESSSLKLILGMVLWGGSIFQVNISESENLKLPQAGVNLAGQPIWNISCNASAGPLAPVPLQDPQKIGSFGLTQLKYNPAAAGAVSEITFNFSPQMSVLGSDQSQPETIFLNLKGFVGEYKTSQISAGRYLFNVTWTSETLSLISNQTIKAGDQISIVVSRFFGIKVPAIGVPKNSESLTITCFAVAGPVILNPIKDSPHVSVFKFTSINFSSDAGLRAGGNCTVLFSFVPSFVISYGDIINIFLPGFTTACTTQEARCVDSTNQNFVVYANQSNVIDGLVVSFRANLSHYLELGYEVIFSGIRLPSKGLKANQSTLQVEVISDLSPILPTSIDKSPAIGSFADTPLLIWDPAATNTDIRIAFCFSPQMLIRSGELVSLFLPKFVVGATLPQSPTIDVQVWSRVMNCSDILLFSPFDTAASQSNITLNVDWISSESQIRFLLNDQIDPETYVGILIPSTSGIRLPSLGLETNQRDVEISSNAVDGPVIKTPVSFLGVGAISDSALNFTDAIANSPADIKISLRATTIISPDSQIIVLLPSFDCAQGSLCSTSQLSFESIPTGCISAVAWDDTQKVCTVFVSRMITKNSMTAITILRNSGLKIPAQGLQSNQQSLLIGIRQPRSSPYGSVLSAPFTKVSPVGAFIYTPELTFDPPKVGENITLSFSLRMYMDLDDGDTVVLNLPGFKSANSGGPASAYASSQYVWQSMGSKLVFSIAEALEAGTDLAVLIPASYGLQLPGIGLQPPSGYPGKPNTAPNITISITSANGPIPPVPVNFVPVGSFTNSTKLSYDYPAPGVKSGISFYFYAGFPILQNERLQLELPDFKTQRSGQITLDGDRKFLQAYWDNDRTVLEITANQDIDVGSFARIHVPEVLYLPTQGLQSNQLSLKIASYSVLGPMLPTSISYSAPVGSFVQSSLSFSNAIASGLTGITLSFSANMVIGKGEIVGVLLPRFDRFNSNSSSLSSFSSSPDNIIDRVSWNDSGPQLLMTLSQQLSSNTVVNVVVSASEGIILPANGVRINQPNCPSPIRLIANPILPTQIPCSSCCQISDSNCDLSLPSIWTNAREGPVDNGLQSPVPRTLVHDVQPVGVVQDVAISYNPPYPGRPVGISISFKPAMPLRVNDAIYLRFPNFGLSGASLRLVIAGVGIADISKNLTVLEIKLSITTCFARSSKFIFSLPVLAGIQLPEGGLRGDAAGITISIAAEDGPIPTTEIISSSIGYFMNTSLELNPPRAGSVTELRFNFTPTMNLQAGDAVILQLPKFNFSGFCSTIVNSTIYNGSNTVVNATIVWANCTSQYPWWPVGIQNSIVFVVAENVDSKTPITVVVPTTAGFYVPEAGLFRNDESITLWANAADGSLYAPGVPVLYSFQVLNGGKCVFSSISFDPPKFDFASNITLSFILSSMLYYGDVVTVSLPEFQGDSHILSKPVGAYQTQTWSIFRARWDGVSSSLLLTALQIVPENSKVVSIISTSNLSTPVLGVQFNETNLTLAVSAAAGPIMMTRFDYVAPVGSLHSTSLTFTGKLPTAESQEPSEIVISFISSFPFIADDKIVLHLPGFSTINPNASFATSCFGGFFTLGHWNGQQEALTLSVSEYTSLNSKSIEVTIPCTAGMLLPPSGLDRSKYSISSDSKYGPIPVIPPTRLEYVKVIGGFLDSSIQIGNPQASGDSGQNIYVSMNISFSAMMDIFPNEKLYVILPYFKVDGIDLQTFVVSSVPTNAIQNRVNWNNLKGLLSMSVSNLIPKNTTVFMSLPSNIGLRLPRYGFSKILNIPALATNAADGPVPFVPPTPFQWKNSTQVGALQRTALDFFPRKAGAPTQLQFSFIPAMSLHVSEIILLRLETVLGASNNMSCGRIIQGKRMQTAPLTWSLSNTTLSITITVEISAAEEVIIIIPSSVGLLLPSQGIPGNFSGFSFAIPNAVDGAIQLFPSIPISESPAIGVFNDTVLGVDPSCSSSFNISFRPSMAIFIDEKIYLEFPGIAHPNLACQGKDLPFNERNNTCAYLLIKCSTWPQDTNFTANLTCGKIEFSAQSTVFANSTITIAISETEGVILPASIDESDTLAIKLSTNATAGQVLPTSISKLSKSSLFSRIPTASVEDLGTNTFNIDVNVSLRKDLLPGSKISIEFLDFMPMNCSNSSCISGDPVSVDLAGDSRNLFVGSPATVLCTSKNHKVNIGCSWTADDVQSMYGAEDCYSIICPENCMDTFSLAQFKSCAAHTAGNGQSSFSKATTASICHIALRSRTISSRGGSLLLAILGNASADICTLTDPRSVWASGGKWIKVGAPHIPVSWQQNTQTLWMEVGDTSIESNKSISLRIPKMVLLETNSAGIDRIRVDVERIDDSDECNTDGKSAFLSSAVSLVQKSSISFVPALIGAAASIQIRFLPRSGIAAFESILVYLPEFTGANADIPLVLGPSGSALRGTWSENKTTLNMSILCGSSLPANETVDFTIPSTAGIRIPISGIFQNQASLKLEIQGTAGNVPPTSFQSSPAIGAFSDSSLGFEKPFAGTTAQKMIFSFTYGKDFNSGDNVSFRLPGFRGMPGVVSVIDQTPPGGVEEYARLQITGYQTMQGSIIFTINQTTITKFTKIIITVGSYLLLPYAGITSQSPEIVISTDAIVGSVENQPVPFVQNVGSFLTATGYDSVHVSFIPPKAGHLCTILISFVPQMKILSLETVTVVLPDFKGNSSRTIYVDGSSSSEFYIASWDAAKYELTLTVRPGKTVLPEKKYSIAVNQSAQIAISDFGLRSLENESTISCNASSGPVLPTRIKASPVGSFLDDLHYQSLSLIIDPAHQYPTNLKLNLFPQMQILVNETIDLLLPDFSLDSQNSSEIWLESVPFGKLTSATWNSSSFKLRIVVSDFIPDRTRLSIIIASTQGLQLPPSGIRWNQTSIKISTDASDGPVQDTSLPLITAVGQLWGVEGVGKGLPTLSFDSAGPGYSSNLFLRFLNTMPLNPGDVALLTLPHFGGNECQFSTRPHFILGSWDPSSSMLALTVGDFVPSQTNVSVLIPFSSCITLPADGIRRAQSIYTIQVIAAEGNTAAIPLYVQPIGKVAGDVRIEFPTIYDPFTGKYGPKTGVPTPIVINFQFQMNLAIGETVSFYFTNFTSPFSIGRIKINASVPFNSFVYASWFQTKNELILTANSAIVALTNITVLISSTSGIQLPMSGISGSSNFSIETNAADGPILHAGFYNITSPALEIPATEFSFGGAMGKFKLVKIALFGDGFGNPVSILIKLLPSMRLQIGDMIWIYFPSLECHNCSNILNQSGTNQLLSYWDYIAISFSAKARLANSEVFRDWNCSWSNTSILALTVLTSMPPDYLSIYVSSSAGIYLPRDPSFFDPSKFITFSNAADGAVSATKSQYVSSFGALLFSELSYNPAQAGVLSEINLRFSVLNDLIQNDTVILTLQGFSRKSQKLSKENCSNNIAVAGNHIFDAWCLSDVDTTIRLVLRSSLVSGGEVVKVVISSKAGIFIPSNGLIVNQSSLTLSSNSVFGPFQAHPIKLSPAVGSLIDSSLTFGNGLAGQVSMMTFNLTFSMKLTKGDSIEVYLPSFSSTRNLSFLIISIPSGVIKFALWRESNNTLQFFVDMEVPERNPLSLQVPTNAGIRLPKSGILGWKSGITISTNSTFGPILKFPPYALSNVQSVGSFIFSSIKFSPAYSGAAATINITFSASMNLSAGESIRITLPSFTLSAPMSTDNFYSNDLVELNTNVLSDPPAKVGSAFWNASASEMILLIQDSIQAKLFTSIYVPSVAGITLPGTGLKENQLSLLIMANCSQGSVFPTPFMSTQIVPKTAKLIFNSSIFRSEPSITFDPMLSGSPSAITLHFILNSELVTGTILTVDLPEFSGNNGTSFITGGNYVFNGLYRNELVCNYLCGDSIESSDNNDTCFNMSAWPVVSSCTKLCHRVSALELVSPKVAALSEVQVIVPISAIIMLPPYGLLWNETRIICNLLNESIRMLSVSVGTFSSAPFITFTPPVAAAKAAVNISFVASLALTPFDSIRVRIPNFEGPAFTDYPVVSEPNLLVRVRWEPRTNELHFILAPGSFMLACQSAMLYIPSSAGLRVPSQGFEQGIQGNVTIDAKLGVIQSQSFEVPHIGKLYTYLLLESSLPASAGILKILLFASTKILANNSLTLILTDFQASDFTCRTVVSDPAGFVTFSSWMQKTNELAFILNEDLNPMVKLMITIPSSTGLTTPSQGLSVNDTKLKIRSNVTGLGQIEMPISGSSGVMFNFESNMSFSDRTPGANVQIDISISSKFSLQRNDTVTFVLGEFGGENNFFPVQSSGISLYRMISNTLPSDYVCVPCSSDFDGYYSGLCGVSGQNLRVRFFLLFNYYANSSAFFFREGFIVY